MEHLNKEDSLKPTIPVPAQCGALPKKAWRTPELACYGEVSVATKGVIAGAPGDGINNLTV
jgi:hypothetical protein